MGKLYSLHCVVVYFLLLVQLFTSCSGVKTGPLIRDLIKAEGIRKNGVFLANFDPEYSVLLNLHQREDKGDEPRREVEQGEFFVRAPTNYGLIAVVQYISLRTQIRGHSREKAIDVCRDFIKFSDTRGNWSQEICGYLYIHDLNPKPSKLIGQRTFYSPNGEINVNVFIDKSDEEEMVNKLWNTVQISFTAVTDCGEGMEEKSKDGRAVRPCYPNKTINNLAPTVDCISSSLFCDKVYNCGFEEQLIGTDETGCQRASNNFNGLNGRNDGGSVSGLMIFFIVAGVILVLVFVGAYIVSELNISLTTCPPRMGLQHGSSSTRIGKETDHVQGSSTGTTTSNYSNFSIEPTR